jgi:hypothetical protein
MKSKIISLLLKALIILCFSLPHTLISAYNEPQGRIDPSELYDPEEEEENDNGIGGIILGILIIWTLFYQMRGNSSSKSK